MTTPTVRVALIIAGPDSVGSAGIQAGLRTFAGCVAKTGGTLVKVAFVLTPLNHRHPSMNSK